MKTEKSIFLLLVICSMVFSNVLFVQAQTGQVGKGFLSFTEMKNLIQMKK